jgi:hypothetical protein
MGVSRRIRDDGAVGLLASPRRRRRLAWVAAAVGVVGLLLVVNALLPSHGGPVKGVQVAPQAPVFGGPTTTTTLFSGESPAAARARKRAEATVHPLADAFVGDLIHRRQLRAAHSLLAPALRAHYALGDWEAGRNLPIASNALATAGTTVAFSGGTTVGLVASLPGGADATLVALRFDKTKGHWLIDYLHSGHSSTRIDETNFAPPGFLPGSHVETVWTWLILVGGLLGLILAAAVVSRALRGPSLG